MRNLTLKVDEKSCNPTFYRVVSPVRRARPDCFVLGFFQFRAAEFFSSPGAYYQAIVCFFNRSIISRWIFSVFLSHHLLLIVFSSSVYLYGFRLYLQCVCAFI